MLRWSETTWNTVFIFWSPQYRKDAVELERVQRTTNMVRDLKAKFYVAWLKEFVKFSLKKSKLRDDVIAVFQYVKGYHREEVVDLFSPATEGKTRSSGENFTVSDPNTNQRGVF